MEKSKNKYFTMLKVLALVTLCCTVVLWIALWVASATPGSVSGSNTDKVTGILDDKFDLEDKVGSKNEIQKIALTRKDTTKKFCGDTERFRYRFCRQNSPRCSSNTVRPTMTSLR